MSRMLRINDEIEVVTEEHKYFGRYKSQDEQYVCIQGRIGENNNKRILIPQRDVKTIVIVHRPEE